MGVRELERAERVSRCEPADCHEADEVARGLVSSLTGRFGSHISTEGVAYQLREMMFEKVGVSMLMGGENTEVNPNFCGLFRKGSMRVEIYENCLFNFVAGMSVGEPFARIVVRGPIYYGDFSFN